jgi:hypothetical protein
VLSKNRRSTAGEKGRTLELLLQHVESQGKDLARMTVHELKRSILVDFMTAYAVRQGKEDIHDLKIERDKAKEKERDNAGKAKKDTASHAPAELQGLSARTVLKAVSHLNDFFIVSLRQLCMN